MDKNLLIFKMQLQFRAKMFAMGGRGEEGGLNQRQVLIWNPKITRANKRCEGSHISKFLPRFIPAIFPEQEENANKERRDAL